MRHSGCQNKPLRLRSGVYAFVVCFARISFAISVLSICSCWGPAFALCYLYAISVLSMLSHAGGYFLGYAISVLSLCYLCAISVLSMLSHAGGYFLRYAISVLSLCYLCYLMLSLCYLCAIYMIFLVNLRRHTQIQA